jgi:hypothetical protein
MAVQVDLETGQSLWLSSRAEISRMQNMHVCSRVVTCYLRELSEALGDKLEVGVHD